jgi:hypothetical protein
VHEPSKGDLPTLVTGAHATLRDSYVDAAARGLAVVEWWD